ncbi:unnamed protein product [Ostreobium quekettii]|uniref:DUF1995 domain-containing protein n=1 Tax=Ostreobium quekettii TaxID=121088 RepID=A0A8S1IX07_9CHLO|nr:unnamed protein product [Ostreobium quekettii]
MGVTAMLKNQWPDAPFEIDCLNDLRPYKDEDEVIVMAAVDPLGADDCRRIAAEVLDEKPLILFNPRLSSGEVGVGLNMRRIQNQFLQTFLVTYSIRPLGDIGSVFRRYPGMWQVFVEDKEAPGRYRVAAERPSRPGGEALEYIIKSALNPGAADAEGQGGQPGLLDQISSTVSSIQRFMKSISK